MEEATTPPDVDRSRLDRYFDPNSLDSDPTLVGSECTSCSAVHFPVKDWCPHCLGDLRRRKLSRTGTLYTYSTVVVGPTGYESPYTTGYVDLPEDIRIFSVLIGDGLEIGCEMEVTTGTIAVRDGVEIVGYQFRHTEGSS